MAAAEVSSSIGFHPLLGQRPGVFDGLLADLSEARIDRGIVLVGRLALEHAARTEFGAVGRILRVVRQLGLFLGVEVIEVAEEFVEAVHRRQRFIAIADVVLAELAGGVAEALEQAADRRIELAHAHRRAGKANLGQARANPVLTGEKRRASGRAALLARNTGGNEYPPWRCDRCWAFHIPLRRSCRH